MEGKMPLLRSFKNFVMTQKTQLKEMARNKEYGIIFLYFLFIVLPIVVIFTFGIIKTIETGAFYWYKYYPKEEIPFAPKTLTYKRLQQEQDKEGLYHSLFEIVITNPAGNTNSDASVTITGIDITNTECEQGSETERLEINPGIATSTKRFLISCISKEHILDNGRLFGIIE
ncbi:MAG: hypothetical protein Q7R89_03220 [bacterium]|nr:hypothetical protein [bacterium]